MTEASEVKVTMEDGRVVDFSGKRERKMLKDGYFDDKGNPHVRFDFRNGKTIHFKVPHKLLGQFALHGALQKIGDTIVGEEEVDDCFLAVEAMCNQLSDGEWNSRKTGEKMAGTSVLLKALVLLTGKSNEQIKEFLANKTHAEKVALRGDPKVKPFVDKVEAERAANKKKTVDTEALLGELEEAPEAEAAAE